MQFCPSFLLSTKERPKLKNQIRTVNYPTGIPGPSLLPPFTPIWRQVRNALNAYSLFNHSLHCRGSLAIAEVTRDPGANFRVAGTKNKIHYLRADNGFP
jgi:hypothetical protein